MWVQYLYACTILYYSDESYLQGNLQFVRTIEGRTRYSRFGHAMANLGDINGDGFDGTVTISIGILR